MACRAVRGTGDVERTAFEFMLRESEQGRGKDVVLVPCLATGRIWKES